MNKQKLEQLIQQYKGEYLADFLYEAGFEESKRQLDEVLPHDDIFSECLQLGELRTSDNQKVMVVETKVINDLSERSSRKKQFDIGKKLLQNSPAYAAGLFVFHDTHGNFRLSLVHPKFEGTRRTYNSFKRYTFYVSPSHSNKTFINQLTSASFDTLDSIKQAFSVAKVTSDFFKEYKRLFEQIVEHIKRDEHFPKFAEESGITVNDVAKKLLGQIVFLYFLQRKGWLGAPKGEHVSKGNQNFLRNLFSKAKAEKAASPDTQMNFFNDYLEYLFYDALNKPITDSATSCYRQRFDCQIPFLNGGLFEPIPEYKWKERFLQIPDDIFSNKDNSGVLDIFDSYNFTIDENSTDDQEVSVDPEMLGKVFENLLEENLRKGTGSYYTPREIVQYMVAESLKQYLIEKTHITPQKVTIALEEYHNDCEITPEEAEAIDKALREIKVVDPACGSGAFLVALLQEIAHIRRYCQQCYETTPQTYYQIKKEIIRDSVYGVDLDPGAVDIARLRFWLSMVVDHETGIDDIEPLPNLDYKLMQGNSLLEDMYVGDIKIKLNFDSGKRVDRRTKQGKLIDDGEIEVETQTLGFSEETGERIADKLVRYHHEYFAEKDPAKKSQLKKMIDGLESELIVAGHDDALTNLRSQLKNSQKEAEKKKLKERIEGVEESKSKWLKFKIRPYFPWKLHFSEVFERGGFDIVIGNPPYFNIETLGASSVEANAIKQNYPSIWQDKSDILFYFFGKAIDISNGSVSFIVSNAFLFSDKASKLRNHMLEETAIKKIVNFEKLQVFKEASITTAIVFLNKKTQTDTLTQAANLRYEAIDDSQLSDLLKSNTDYSNIKFEKDEVFAIVNDEIRSLNKKIDSLGEPLNKLYKVGSGMQTGANKVFVFAEYPIHLPSEYIKNRVTGNNISKYRLLEPKNYLLYVEDTEDFNDLPKVIQEYLIKNEEALKNRADKKRRKNDKWWNYVFPMHKDFYSHEKIWCSYRAKENIFAIDETRNNIGLTNTTVIFNTNVDLHFKYVLALLNSKLLNFRYKSIGKQTGGGIYEYFENGVGKLPIAKSDTETQVSIVNLVEKIESALKNSEDYTLFQDEIDKIVMQIYNLSDEERKVVLSYE